MKGKPYGEKTAYEKKLFWRKFRLYLAWALMALATIALSLHLYNVRFTQTIEPQIRNAYTQIAKLLPELKRNEQEVAKAYEQMTKSREDFTKAGIADTGESAVELASIVDILDGFYADELISQFSVGNSGGIIIADRQTGAIIAHPDAEQLGKTLMVSPLMSGENDADNLMGVSIADYKGLPDVDLELFNNEKEARKVELKRLILFPGDVMDDNFIRNLNKALIGSIVTYEDVYVACGINFWEFLAHIVEALFISIIASVLLWLFVHFIVLTIERHELNGATLRTQLTAYGLVLAVAVFGISWYIQVLDNITGKLNTMSDYANEAVSRQEMNDETRKSAESWLDQQYLAQCRLARNYVKRKDAGSITRQELAELSTALGVKYVYVFDRNGQVIVTNSPYDHFTLSNDPAQPSYAFRSLLEGADHVIQAPGPDEISGDRVQAIGVSLRNAEDKADGFVQISVDPAFRNYLLLPLGIDSVLQTMTMGLPQHGLVVDRQSMTIAATTGLGYEGQSIEDMGYTAEKLAVTRNGYLDYNGKSYYAGFSASDDYYMIPMYERTVNKTALQFSLYLTLAQLAGLALIIVLALFHYQSDVVDAAPPAAEAEEAPVAHESIAVTLSNKAMNLTGLSNLVQTQEKKGFDKRWHTQKPADQQTPGARVRVIAHRILFIFCVFNLLPLAYGMVQATPLDRLDGLSYVISGGWEKGPNIFAFSSCLILLYALYLFVTIADKILYSIAKVSNLRMETVCLLLKSSLKYVCVIVFIYFGLSKFGIPTQALLASAGIITLAVSMGAKDLVNDIIAGFFILVEGNVKVGDFVTVGSWRGTVEQIGLRTTRVNSYHETKIINNSNLRDIVNADQEVARVSLKLPVAMNANLAEIEAIIAEELPTMMDDASGVVAPPRYEGIDGISDGNMILRISASVQNGKHMGFSRELYRRLKLMFDRRGIELPVNPGYYYETDITPKKAN